MSVSGCSSDDSGSDPITCPQGYVGPNCETQITPSKIRVTKIRLKYFPILNGTSSWDFDSAPDIFVRFGHGNGTDNTTLLYESGYYEDVLSDGTTTFDFTPINPIVIDNPFDTYVIILGDYDSVSLYDFMGGFTFVPYSSTNQFPESITVSDLSIPLSFELMLSYEWNQ